MVEGLRPGRKGLNSVMAAAGTAAGRKVTTMNQPALSVQLYAVKDQLTDDLDGTLARLSGMGLRHVEAFNFVARECRPRAARSPTATSAYPCPRRP